MTETTKPHAPILVVGGNGKTGRRVAERLTALDKSVRIGSRNAEPAFDWERPETWAPALTGASAAYVTYYPDLAVPGAPGAIEAFSRVAIENGVKRIVLLSGRGEPEAQRSEELLMASGADWTILRCSWFSQNFSEAFFLDPVLDGKVYLPVGHVPEPFIDTDDIADAAVAALTEDGHIGKLHELTGPEAITFDDALGEIARASGRDIELIRIPASVFAEELRNQQIPDVLIDLMLLLFTEVLDGRNIATTDGVRQVLGRAPKSFADYVRETAATGVWNRRN